MITFTVPQMKRLNAGETVERTFAVKPRELGAVEPCPFKEGSDYKARRDGARRASIAVTVLEVKRGRGFPSLDADWVVYFAKTPHTSDLRLLAAYSPSGYTRDEEHALKPEIDGTGDPGEAPPAGRSEDLEVRQILAKRQAAIEAMRDAFGGDKTMARHLRAIERRLDETARQTAA